MGVCDRPTSGWMRERERTREIGREKDRSRIRVLYISSDKIGFFPYKRNVGMNERGTPTREKQKRNLYRCTYVGRVAEFCDSNERTGEPAVVLLRRKEIEVVA